MALGAGNAGYWGAAAIVTLIGLILVMAWRAFVAALALTLALWIAALVILAQRLSVEWPWVGVGVATLAAVIALARWAIWLRHRHMGIRGMEPQTIEWQWVYTGFRFVAQHPLYARLGGIWVVVFWVSAQGLLTAFSVTEAALQVTPPWYLWPIPLLLALIYISALLTLLARAPAAYPLTWVVLILSFPLSLPLVVYWADGTRPNLIYRHRFERLVPSG